MTHPPELPTFGPRDPIPAGPVTCVDCGQPLELSCAGACGKTGESIEAAAKADPSHASNLAPKKARTYQAKVCACGTTFTPTGPRGVKCAACKAGQT